MRFRVTFSAAVASVCLLASLAPTALADPPSLSGVFLVGDPITSLTASCDPAGTSTITYTSTGTATAPYAGTYTESGTVVIGPHTLPVFVNGFQAGPVTSLDATFTISSITGTATGTKHLDPAATLPGFCYDFTNRSVGDSVLSGTFREVIPGTDGFGLTYTATVVTPGGAWTDSGISGLSITEFTSTAVSGANAQQTSVFNEAYRSQSFVPVTLSFGGFYEPVNNPPTVNAGKAGRTYPVKWSLTDADGATVTSLSAVSSITSQNMACGAFSSDPTDALETTASGGSVLRYDLSANQYVYNWQTPGKGCYTLFVTLADGTVHTAYFDLK